MIMVMMMMMIFIFIISISIIFAVVVRQTKKIYLINGFIANESYFNLMPAKYPKIKSLNSRILS